MAIIDKQNHTFTADALTRLKLAGIFDWRDALLSVDEVGASVTEVSASLQTTERE